MVNDKRKKEANKEADNGQVGEKGGQATAEDLGILEEEEIDFYEIMPEDAPEGNNQKSN